MPRSHFSVFFEIQDYQNIFPTKLSVSASIKDTAIFSKTYTLCSWKNTKNYEILHKGNSILFTGFVDNVFGLPDTIRIECKTPSKKYSKTIALSYARIKGKTTDFDGNAFPAAIVFMRKLYGGRTPCLGVWSNMNGEYSILIPTGKYDAFYVDDNSYNISTLENWSWNIIVEKDETYDFKIGNAEIYDLSAKKENDCLYLSFRPMVMTSMRYEESEIVIDSETYSFINIQPDIALENISVFVEGQSITVSNMERTYATFFDKDRKVALIVYNIKAKLPFSIRNKALIILEYKTANRYKACSQGRTQLYTAN